MKNVFVDVDLCGASLDVFMLNARKAANPSRVATNYPGPQGALQKRMSAPTKKTEKIHIDAVFYDQLDNLVPDFHDKLITGHFHCKHCGDDINQAGIYSVTQITSGLEWCCQKLECVEKQNRNVATND